MPVNSGKITPVISVIIPCYNSGRYLPDALNSINNYPDKSIYEIIIVDDGSSDELTLALLDSLRKEGYKIIRQQNGGPAAARNTGVKSSNGKYLLFLDSDNKVRNDYITKGIEILNTYEDVGVVYGNVIFFGESAKPRFATQHFDMFKLLGENYIDICSVVRRKVWEDVGGLDENRDIMGYEDWEFWISVASHGWKFQYVNEILYEYRVRTDSLFIQASDQESSMKMLQYVYGKHLNLFAQHHSELYHKYLYYQNDRKKPLRSFIKYIYYKYFKSMA